MIVAGSGTRAGWRTERPGLVHSRLQLELDYPDRARPARLVREHGFGAQPPPLARGKVSIVSDSSAGGRRRSQARLERIRVDLVNAHAAPLLDRCRERDRLGVRKRADALVVLRPLVWQDQPPKLPFELSKATPRARLTQPRRLGCHRRDDGNRVDAVPCQPYLAGQRGPSGTTRERRFRSCSARARSPSAHKIWVSEVRSPARSASRALLSSSVVAVSRLPARLSSSPRACRAE